MSGYEALRTSAGWLDLSERGKIRVTGEDRARLLHAMTTNHVQGLEALRALYAFFLNDKGRILADAWIYNLGDALLLDTEPETRAKVFEHLDRYIIADDAEVTDESKDWAAIAVEGPRALAVAAALGVPVGPARLDVLAFGAGCTVHVTATGAEGWRVILPTADKDEFVSKLQDAGVAAVSADEARVVRIENGRARYGEEISERYLVQETQILEAIHPNKGCYLGQEIVERVRSRGQVHRVLTPVRIAGTVPPAAGTKLAAEGMDVGEISSAAYSAAFGEVVGLAYVRTEAAHAKPALVIAGSEPPVAARVA